MQKSMLVRYEAKAETLCIVYTYHLSQKSTSFLFFKNAIIHNVKYKKVFLHKYSFFIFLCQQYSYYHI